MTAWCLFEQSGTFKNAFKEFGFEAYDCDILDDFKQTDFKVDLFKDIEYEFEKIQIWQDYHFDKKVSYGEFLDNKSDYLVRCRDTIFDKISSDDLVFAFYPCVKFTEKSFLNTRCMSGGTKDYSDLKKVRYTRNCVNDIAHFYEILTKLCEIAILKGFKLIIENPNSQPHFLNLYFPFKPAVSIADRSKYGDCFIKPTNFWFFNCEPKNNFLMKNFSHKSKKLYMGSERDKNELLRWFEKEHGLKISNLQKARSMINPTFARIFIKKFILSADELEKIS